MQLLAWIVELDTFSFFLQQSLNTGNCLPWASIVMGSPPEGHHSVYGQMKVFQPAGLQLGI